MKEIKYLKYDETLFYYKMANGLDVYFLPKEKYHKTYVTLTANFGSLDNDFLLGEREISLPHGVAHFLEHKLFEMANGEDAFLKLTELGANANAYTSYSRTCYMFSITSNLIAATNILLDFVFESNFKEESVEREKRIIEQEIKMYEDYPESKAMTYLLKNMYHTAAIRNEIAGTVSTIQEINVDILNKVYQTFYHPENMQMFVVGNFCLEDMKNAIEENLMKKSFQKFIPPQIIKNLEDAKVVKDYDMVKMDVEMPKVYVGLKFPQVEKYGIERLKFELTLSLVLGLLFSESSDNYEYLLQEQLINDSFGAFIEHEAYIDTLIIATDTLDPKRFTAEIKEIFLNKNYHIFAQTSFNRIKNSIIGKYLNVLDSLEAIANLFTRYSFLEMDFFKILDVIKEIEVEDVEKIINQYFNEESLSFYVVMPK